MTYKPVMPRAGVVTLSGYGVRLAVDRGHLLIEDGVGTDRHRTSFSRIDSDLKRVVIIGHSGTITLDAIRWLHDVGVPLIHLDHDGRLYFVSSRAGRTIAELRRAQVRAADTDRGIRIAQDLLRAKIGRQLALLDRLPESETASNQLQESMAGVRRSRSVVELRDWEAKAARAYWRVWRHVSLRIKAADAQRRPAHWRFFGSRYSPLAGLSPRKAVNPANAVLNYLYAIVEAEVTIAAMGARLDPTLGLLHADRTERFSLTHDLMEPVRPAVDAYALSMFAGREFTKEDVFERYDGHCRLLPPLARELAATASLWAREAAPVVDGVAAALVTGRRAVEMIVPGVPMLRRRKPRTRNSVVRGFEEIAPSSWAETQERGTSWKGTRKWRRIAQANLAWDREHGMADSRHYRSTIQPKLNQLSLQELSVALGLSRTTCSQFRTGTRIPHPRHWETLEQLVMAR